MIDCSRQYRIITYLTSAEFFLFYFSDGNSQKNHLNQSKVLASISTQLASGTASSHAITGVMVESHLHAGRQDVPPEGPAGLKHGISITDACVDWEMTVDMLNELDAVSSCSSHSLLLAEHRCWSHRQ